MFLRYVGIHKFLKVKFWFKNSLGECTWQGKIKKRCVSVDFPPLNWDFNGWFTNCPPIQHMFFRHNFTEKGKIYSDFAEKSPYGAITNSEVSASNSLFLCWLAHLVGFNSEPKIFRRYEQVRFTTILGDYFRIFFGVSSRTGFEPSPTKTPWRSEEVKELMDVVRWFHRKTLLSVRGLTKGFLWRCWFKNDRDILKPCEEIDSRVLNLLNCSAMFCHVLPFQSFPGVLQVALLAEENERLREDCWQRLGQRLLQLVGES